MVDKFQNTYRIPSARLLGWDYRWAGAYFITICTAQRQHFFGHVANGKMELSKVGVIADLLWCEIKNHTKNVQLGEFVVMPNHVHGILILDGSFTETEKEPTPDKDEFMSAISPKADSVSTIIRSYKSAVSKYCKRLGFEFGWQTRFYDHIIRDEKSFRNISNYIVQNPVKWQSDEFFGGDDGA